MAKGRGREKDVRNGKDQREKIPLQNKFLVTVSIPSELLQWCID